jgi:GNAT superfamily N-acetyltransferase
VLDGHSQVAAYSLFWFDPVTATGLVEPMRTEAAHQRRGLARHLLGAGIDRLTAAGARRVKVCYGPGNRAARNLYFGAGFESGKQTAVFSRRDV